MSRYVIKYLTPAPPMLNLDTQLVSRDVGRNVSRLAITLADFGVMFSDGREQWIRRGFPTDYGSIPPSGQMIGGLLRMLGLLRGVTSLDPTDGATLQPIIKHDADYSLQDAMDVMWGWKREGRSTGLVRDDFYPKPPVRTKADADKDLRDGLLITARPRASVYYRAVHWLGYWSWYKANSPLMDGYIHSVRSGTSDQWMAHVATTYTQPINLEPARD